VPNQQHSQQGSPAQQHIDQLFEVRDTALKEKPRKSKRKKWIK
jgi:hypothetical protein